MIRHMLLASVGAVALAGSAFAADLPSRAPPPVYIPPAPIFTWTGLYVGGQVGYAWAKNHVDFTDDFGDFNPFSYNSNGVIGGAHVGYNIQFSQFVVGLEGDVDGTSLSKSFNGTGALGAAVFGVPVAGNVNIHVAHEIEGSIRGRLGWALGGLGWDRVLVYGTGGVAFGGFNNNVSATFLIPGVVGLGGSSSSSNTRVGWTVGGGLEYAMTDNWSLRAEYRYTDFGRNTISDPLTVFGTPVAFGSSFTRHFTENSVQVGFSYKFGAPPPPPPPVVAKY